MTKEFRPFWNKYLKLNWQFGLLLLLLICIPRFILVLRANETGNYSLIGLVMLISTLVSFIFLNKHGRKQVGIKTTNKTHYLILALAAGLVLSFLKYC